MKIKKEYKLKTAIEKQKPLILKPIKKYSEKSVFGRSVLKNEGSLIPNKSGKPPQNFDKKKKKSFFSITLFQFFMIIFLFYVLIVSYSMVNWPNLILVYHDKGCLEALNILYQEFSLVKFLEKAFITNFLEFYRTQIESKELTYLLNQYKRAFTPYEATIDLVRDFFSAIMPLCLITLFFIFLWLCIFFIITF